MDDSCCLSDTGLLTKWFYSKNLTWLLGFCVTTLFLCQVIYYYNFASNTPSLSHARLFQQHIGINDQQLTLDLPEVMIVNITDDIDFTLNKQRNVISYYLSVHSPLINSTLARDYEKLIPERGGSPLVNIIVTSWRSGSTFVGDALNEITGNFYHYEPLLDYGIVKIRGPPSDFKALLRLKRLIACDYQPLRKSYLSYGEDHTYLFYHNRQLWNVCQQKPYICWLPEFLTPFCKIFPFQYMKIVRLRLSIIEELLKDKRLNVKVVYILRDPRGSLQSRRHRSWCPSSADCSDATTVCADLISDFSASVRLFRKYPDNFRIIRFEDLALNPYEITEKLLNFFGFRMDENIVDYLDKHTKSNYGGVSSTFRDSKNVPFQWRFNITFDEASAVQNACAQALKLWGYKLAFNETHLKSFIPISTQRFNSIMEAFFRS